MQISARQVHQGAANMNSGAQKRKEKHIGLPTVPEWPGQSRNLRRMSRVPGWVTFAPEVTGSSLP